MEKLLKEKFGAFNAVAYAKCVKIENLVDIICVEREVEVEIDPILWQEFRDRFPVY